MCFSVIVEHVLIIYGKFLSSNVEFYGFNVYVPCDNAAKSLLWDFLFVSIKARADLNVCVCGDLNEKQV